MKLLSKLLPSHQPKPAHLALGERGEALAAKFLRQYGYKILVCRYRSENDEIDLACRHGDTLVFVEVKTRASEEFGRPSAAVTAEKQKNLSRAALHYLREIGHPEIPIRFDIVEVIMADARTAAEIRHLENAFPLTKGYYY